MTCENSASSSLLVFGNSMSPFIFEFKGLHMCLILFHFTYDSFPSPLLHTSRSHISAYDRATGYDFIRLYDLLHIRGTCASHKF